MKEQLNVPERNLPLTNSTFDYTGLVLPAGCRRRVAAEFMLKSETGGSPERRSKLQNSDILSVTQNFTVAWSESTCGRRKIT